MRIRRRDMRLGAVVLGVCGVAVALTAWAGADGQSGVAAEGGVSIIEKSAPSRATNIALRGAQAGNVSDAPRRAADEEAPAELWQEDQSAPAELWENSEAPASEDVPAELWAEPPFSGAGEHPGNDASGLLVKAAAHAPQPAARPGLSAPSDVSYKGWVMARAEEFLGGVDRSGMPLYRFNLWLNAPIEHAAQVAKVAYTFDAPSATQTALASADRSQDFRVQFGASSCPKRVDVELTFTDGRVERHQVDGCAILQ